MTKRLFGCIPIVVTPFDAQGRVDDESLRREVEWLIAGGVHGLATLALASEGYKLSEPEREQVARAVIAEARGRVPVVVSADHSGADAAVERARQAEAWGADAVMVLPPSFIKPDGDALYRYYAAVAAAIAAPVIVQDAPQLTGVNLPAAFLARLFREFPHVNVAKLEGVPSGPKISEILALTDAGMTVFTGWGGLGFWDGLLRGDVGCMPAACFGASLARVYDLYAAGKVAEAWACFDAQAHFVAWSMQSLDISVWTSKMALLREGVIASAFQRDPATPGDPVMQAQFDVYWKQFRAR